MKVLSLITEDSQHQEITPKELPAIRKSANLRLIVFFSGIVGVRECCITTQDGKLTLGLQCRIGHEADAFRKVIPHHASQGNEVKDKDIPFHLIALTRLRTLRVLIAALEWRR